MTTAASYKPARSFLFVLLPAFSFFAQPFSSTDSPFIFTSIFISFASYFFSPFVHHLRSLAPSLCIISFSLVCPSLVLYRCPLY